jgi:hypothetical protein
MEMTTTPSSMDFNMIVLLDLPHFKSMRLFGRGQDPVAVVRLTIQKRRQMHAQGGPDLTVHQPPALMVEVAAL